MALRDEDAKQVDASITVAHWETVEQAVAAAYLRWTIDNGKHGPMYVLPIIDKFCTSMCPSDFDKKRALAVIDSPPLFQKPTPETPRARLMDQELAEARRVIDELKARVDDIASRYNLDIKAEHQPQ